MVALGHTTTLPVTLDQMLHHTQAVARGFSSPASEHPLLISDLPFLSYQCGEDLAVAAAGRLLKESPAAAVKLEGAEPEVVDVINRLVRMGIPVMGHLGLTPQSVHQMGYRRQAVDAVSQERLQAQAAVHHPAQPGLQGPAHQPLSDRLNSYCICVKNKSLLFVLFKQRRFSLQE